MLHLDLSTLLILLVVITSLMAGMMFYYTYTVPQIKGPKEWGIASILLIISLFLVLFSSKFGDYVAIGLSCTFSIVSYFVYLMGIQKFNGKQPVYWLIIGIPIAQFFTFTLFEFVIYSPLFMISFYLLFNLLYALIALSEFRKPEGSAFEVPFRLGAWVYILHGFTVLLRGIYIYLDEVSSPLLLGDVNQLFFLSNNLAQGLLLCVFIMLVSTRLNVFLKDEIDNHKKFFSVLAHDLNGPVGNFYQMIKFVNEHPDIESKQEIMEGLERLSGATHTTLQNLLFWANDRMKDMEPDKENVNIDEIIARNLKLTEQLRKSKSIKIKYHREKEFFIYVDAVMIDTVVRNMISNAVKFTNIGGIVEIYMEKSNGYRSIVIKDNGVGMSEDRVSEILTGQTRFTTLGTQGEKGAGIGMTICKEFTKRNNGKINIESEVERGTKVTISFPKGEE